MLSQINVNKTFWQTIKHFKRDEFKCKCGCNINHIDKVCVSRLDVARIIAGIPFFINSAFRCVPHNVSIGGSLSSSHLLGYAFDIKVNNSSDRFIILNALIKAGFTRIGVYKDFIHVDGDLDKVQNVIWYI